MRISRRAVRIGGASIGALVVAVGVVATLSSRAEAGTVTIVPTALTTIEGRTGSGQGVGNLAAADLSGRADRWNQYVEFVGRYAGYLDFSAPPGLAPDSVTSADIQVDYRGPAPATQTWTFSLLDWSNNAWVRVGTNASAPDWGAWTRLTFRVPQPHARFVSATGGLRLGIASNNRHDAVNLDHVSITLAFTARSAPSPQVSAQTSSATPPPVPAPATSTAPPTASPAATTSAAPTTAAAPPSATAAVGSGPVPCPACWRPELRTSWNWVLGTVPKAPFRDVEMYIVDGADASSADVAALHAAGVRAVCYISAGSYEDWRPDASQFPAAVLGRNLDGWPGERWLDIREIRTSGSVLARIMNSRLDMCDAKGFDGVEFDNVDGYTNRTGFALSAADQLVYNRFLANAAHARGLSAVLKNDVDQIDDLVDYFDMALNEQCNQYNECGGYHAFIQAGKAVFNAEYGSSTSFCGADNAANINGVLFSLDLNDSVYRPCR